MLSINNKVSELTEQEAAFLEANGYILLENMLSEKEVNDLRNLTDNLLEQEGMSAGDVGQTLFQQNLRNSKDRSARIKLTMYDATYFCMRKFAKLLFKALPGLDAHVAIVKQPGFKSDSHFSLFRELKQMIATQAQQDGSGTARLCDLVNKGSEFDILYTHPKLLAAVRQIIGENFKLSSLNYRSPQPNQGLQPLHADWAYAVQPGEFYACNALWLLDDLTLENGATRLIPGSQNYGSLPGEVLDNPLVSHRDEQLVSARAGSIVFINSHVWHSGTRNNTTKPRRIIQSYFVHKAFPAQLHQSTFLKPKTQERITEEALDILNIPQNERH